MILRLENASLLPHLTSNEADALLSSVQRIHIPENEIRETYYTP